MGDHTYLWIPYGEGRWAPEIQARSECVLCHQKFEIDFKEVKSE